MVSSLCFRINFYVRCFVYQYQRVGWVEVRNPAKRRRIAGFTNPAYVLTECLFLKLIVNSKIELFCVRIVKLKCKLIF